MNTFIVVLNARGRVVFNQEFNLGERSDDGSSFLQSLVDGDKVRWLPRIHGRVAFSFEAPGVPALRDGWIVLWLEADDSQHAEDNARSIWFQIDAGEIRASTKVSGVYRSYRDPVPLPSLRETIRQFPSEGSYCIIGKS